MFIPDKHTLHFSRKQYQHVICQRLEDDFHCDVHTIILYSALRQMDHNRPFKAEVITKCSVVTFSHPEETERFFSGF